MGYFSIELVTLLYEWKSKIQSVSEDVSILFRPAVQIILRYVLRKFIKDINLSMLNIFKFFVYF